MRQQGDTAYGVNLARDIASQNGVASQALLDTPVARRAWSTHEARRVKMGGRMGGRLLVVAAAGILVRVGLIHFAGPESLPRATNDHIVYFQAAEIIARSGDAWLQPIGEFGYRAPLYFILLAALSWALPGFSYRDAQLASSLLGVISGVLLYFIGRRVGGERAGWWSLGLRVFLPNFIIADTFVMSETLFSASWATAVLGFLMALERRRELRGAAVMGFGLALAMLTRESASFLPLIFLAGIAVLPGSIRERAKRLGAAMLILLAVLVPWMVRNEYVWGQPLPIAHTAGVNLYVGNNAESTGKWASFEPIAPAGVVIGTPQASAWYARAAWQYVRENPVTFFANGLKKLAWLMFPVFHRDSMLSVYECSDEAVHWLSVVSGVSSTLLLLVGTCTLVAQGRSAAWRLLLAVIVYQLTLAFIAFGSPRFRDTIDHVLVVSVGAAVGRAGARREHGAGWDPTARQSGWWGRSVLGLESRGAEVLIVALLWSMMGAGWVYVLWLKWTGAG